MQYQIRKKVARYSLAVGVVCIWLIGLRPLAQDGKMLMFSLPPQIEIFSADISPDTQTVVIRSLKRTVKTVQGETIKSYSDTVEVWDFRTQEILVKKDISTWEGSRLRQSGNQVRYSGDGKYLVIYDSNSLLVWQADTLAEVRSFPMSINEGTVRLLALKMEISPTRPLVAVLFYGGTLGHNGVLHIYNFETGNLHSETSLDGWPSGFSWSPNSDRIAVSVRPHSLADKTPKSFRDLWIVDTATGKKLMQIHTGQHGGPVSFGKNSRIYTSTHRFAGKIKRNHKIIVWDIAKGIALHKIEAKPGGIRRHLDISRNSQVLLGYVGLEKTYFDWGDFEWSYKAEDQKFRLWDTETGEVIATSPDLPFGPREYRLAANGKAVLAYSQDRSDEQDLAVIFLLP